MIAGGSALLPSGLTRRLERLQLVSRNRASGLTRGERRSRHRGTSPQFVDYRQYALGDDPRQVDWNVYGRSGNLFVKQFEDETVLSVHICLDVSRSMDWGEPNKLAAGRRLAAAIGYVGLARYDQVQAVALGEDAGPTLGPFWGRERALALFDGLADWRGLGQTDLGAALRTYAGRLGKGRGLAVVISDLLSPTWEAGLRALLNRRHEVAVIHLLAPEEVRPPQGEELRLIDRESGRAIEIHLDGPALDAYARRFAEWTAAIERFCGDHGASYVRLDSDTPLESALFDALRRRRVLA